MNFTNDTIDTLQLPRYEDTELTPIHPLYLRVIWFNIAMIYGTIAIAAGAAFYFIKELQLYWLYTMLGYAVVLIIHIVVQVVSYRNRGYAFRERDVIYRSGAISITTTIIPYNRIQHVAEHEGVIARWLGLSNIGIFTAGGAGSDIVIPGLEKVHAAAVKGLLAEKIEKEAEAAEATDLYELALKQNQQDDANENTAVDEA